MKKAIQNVKSYFGVTSEVAKEIYSFTGEEYDYYMLADNLNDAYRAFNSINRDVIVEEYESVTGEDVGHQKAEMLCKATFKKAMKKVLSNGQIIVNFAYI